MWRRLTTISFLVALLCLPGPLSAHRGHASGKGCSDDLFSDYTSEIARLRYRADFGCHRGHEVGRFRVLGKIRRCVAEDCTVKRERTRCNTRETCRLRFARKHPNPEAATYKWRVRYRSTGPNERTGGAKVVADCSSATDTELCT